VAIADPPAPAYRPTKDTPVPPRFPYPDDRGNPTRLRWWRGDPARNALRPRILALWKPLWPLIAVVCIPVALGVLVLNQGVGIVAMFILSPFVALLMGIAAMLLLAGAAGLRVYLRETSAAMVRAGECPCCAYRLEELVADADGLTTCPECGGGWDRGVGGADGGSAPPHEVVVRA